MRAQPNIAHPLLHFIYLLCFYASIAFPWGRQAGATYGVNIAGYVIEYPLFLILGVLLPFYLLSGSRGHDVVLRRTHLVCWVISIVGALSFMFSLVSNGTSIATTAMVDIKTWFLLWMMPVTVLYVHDRGMDRWLRHFLLATACYCGLLLLARATPYGWLSALLPSGLAKDIYGRISTSNDYALILAVPVAVARLMDRRFSVFVAICLGLYLAQMANAQARTHIGVAAILVVIAISRPGRFGRGAIAMATVACLIPITLYALPEHQRYGLITRLTNLGERTDIYLTMLGTSNAIALDEIGSDPLAMAFGKGFGSQLHLYSGGGAESYRRYVDNLWVTLLFKFGIAGTILIGIPLLSLCWRAARGRPTSSVDRVFKWWAFFMPFLCLRGSFLLWHTTSGVIWSTLAVAAVLAVERRSVAGVLLEENSYSIRSVPSSPA